MTWPEAFLLSVIAICATFFVLMVIAIAVNVKSKQR